MAYLENENDAIGHIESLYGGPDNSQLSLEIWMQSIRDFGWQNLPEKLLMNVAEKMLQEEGEPIVK